MRSVEDIEADLAALYAARSAIASGERVQEYASGGRRMTYATIKVSDINALIIQTEAELARAKQIADGRPVRSAIGTFF